MQTAKDSCEIFVQNKHEGLTLLDDKTHYKTTVINII